jgi:hypothetical protein
MAELMKRRRRPGRRTAEEDLDRHAEPVTIALATKELIKIGSPLGGGLAGAATTVATGDPFAGVGISTIAAAGINRIASDYLARRLSPDERERVGAALLYAVKRIEQRLEAGQTPRQDGFFDKRTLHRSRAEELLDGVLRSAQEAWEQRRISHLGYFWSSVAFREDIAPADANYLLDIAQRLTYRQLVVLALLDGEGSGLPDWEGDRLKTDAAAELLYEISHLGRNGLIRRNYGETVSGPDQFNPVATVRSDLGQRLYEVLELQLVDPDELAEVRNRLKALGEVNWETPSDGKDV